MEHVNILEKCGLFDARVPRYTSFPPANRFELGTGARMQMDWLARIPADKAFSVYVHIPFCRRLCWFCACRTQGTKTMQPVDAYVNDLVAEIDLVASAMTVPPPMARLHFGGGTPTLLNVDQMTRILDAIDRYFARTMDFEFSVEIDPTEAAPEVLNLLAKRGMRRASIGVQDFDPVVQKAIGRRQTYEQTREVVESLRALEVHSLNVDLLYGLPHQTEKTLQATLTKVRTLRPDRLALYGYAHVPHVSKRQVMIPDEALPNARARFETSLSARTALVCAGYDAIGIDHFALTSDSLARAAKAGNLKRNFQGYTDDPCDTLIGFGASAISKFHQGFVQNAVATSAYQMQLRDGRLPAKKGYALSSEDLFLGDMIEQLMCLGCLDTKALVNDHAAFAVLIPQIVDDLQLAFPNAFKESGTMLCLLPGLEALARVVAAHLDVALRKDHIHSAAV